VTDDVLERVQIVAAGLDEAFAFFADPWNLQAITPPWLRFRIVEASTPLEQGSILVYRLRLLGAPIRWRTEITVWEPPHRFVDTQTHGPYSLWEHTHTLEPLGGHSTLIRDRVRYRVPVAAAQLPVKVALRSIFDYRGVAMRRLLG
jgi:ligand-binding SRPBCC domain-containing protein